MIGIRSYSSVHRVRNYFPTLIKPRHVGSSVTFAEPNRTVYEDTLPTVIDGVTSYTYGGTTYTFALVTTDLVTKDITGVIIMHEVGNGVNDSLLSRCILEVFPNSEWRSYDYAAFVDPVFTYNLRSSVWANDGNGENVADLVALNMAVKGGQNPFTSVMQTPTEYLTTSGDKVPFDGDDRYIDSFGSQWSGKPVESLILLAPMNTKFRRALFTFTSVRCVVVRSISVTMTEYNRRSFG